MPRLGAQQPQNFKVPVIFLKLKSGHFVFLLQVLQRLKSQLLCMALSGANLPYGWHPFFMHSLLAAVLTLCFLECTKISCVFCLCTSARLPQMHPTFSERIHTHSSSFSSRTPPATTCPCETHAWLPWAVLGAHLCHWKTRVNTGDRRAKGRKWGFECGLHHLVAATVD